MDPEGAGGVVPDRSLLVSLACREIGAASLLPMTGGLVTFCWEFDPLLVEYNDAKRVPKMCL